MNEIGRIGGGAMEKLRAASAEMDAALKEEGFDEHGPLGVFSRYQRLAIEELGKIVVSAEEKIGGTIDPLCKRIEASTEEFREGQLAELQALFKAGHQVLELAQEATKIAARAEAETQFQYDQSIQRVARTMATALLSETSGWLILKQTNYNRGMAMRFAAIAGAAMLFIAWSGYQVRAWEDGPTMDAAGRCAASSFAVRVGDNPTPQPACLAGSFEPRELKDLPSAVKAWFRAWGS